ncbi:hypothetical protein FA15DRAFT_673531 [Coprinopsis marcescibilis]|uniref:Required for respiratory growth protein 7, mitochondrial n=1 Tax=Coprinopsis marcescibilis TaxID=230819 RepID=A0A5C3KJM5_COPMA|nr:hypothetical protein FA15DRAFT_673531 [Coprinopsis marcescibilis]
MICISNRALCSSIRRQQSTFNHVGIAARTAITRAPCATFAIPFEVRGPTSQQQRRRLSGKTLSAVHRGKAFEERSMKLLETKFSMNLTRVGGRDDGGVDLLGWWWIPASENTVQIATDATANNPPPAPAIKALPTHTGELKRRVRVIAQCKAEKKKMGPNYVRELEGVVHGLRYASGNRLASTAIETRPMLFGNISMNPAGDLTTSEPTTDATLVSERTSFNDAREEANEDSSIVALLISQSPFTKSAILRAQASPLPFFLLHLPDIPVETPDLGPLPRSKSLFANRSVPGLEDQDLAEPQPIGGIVWNRALAGTTGVLKGGMEVRWERGGAGDGAGAPSLWWKGAELACWTPPPLPATEARPALGVP